MVVRNCREVKVREIRFPEKGRTPTEGVAGAFVELELENPGWGGFKPGQFAMLRPANFGQEISWGRPLSISRSDEESLLFFFQVVGRGTERLARLTPGDSVVVWGPLGNGFSLAEGTPTLLLAGGMGIAPFRGYAERRRDPENLRLLFSHRPDISCYPAYAALAARIHAEAIREETPADLPRVIAGIQDAIDGYASGLVLACGPIPFLKTVQERAKLRGIRAELSLERRMACGVGACLGCVCKDGGGKNVRVCARGPVFKAQDVQL